MKSNSNKALLVLQYGFVALFIWFGISQIMDPGSWTGYIPAWATAVSGMSAHTLVLANGILEVVGAGLLACGLWTPIVAFLLALHLLVIALDVGINPIGVRDLGLVVGLSALALLAMDRE